MRKGTWGTAPQLTEPGNMPPNPGLSYNTLRQVVRVWRQSSEIKIFQSIWQCFLICFINRTNERTPAGKSGSPLIC
jgi:hypothetical protein